MFTKIQSLTVLGIVSAAVVASAARMLGQGETPVASLAMQGRVGLANAASGIPTVAAFYTLPLGDITGPRVAFVQDGDILTAIWMTSAGNTYGVGTYRWDAASRSFMGTIHRLFAAASCG